MEPGDSPQIEEISAPAAHTAQGEAGAFSPSDAVHWQWRGVLAKAAVALGCVGFALLVRWLLDPWLGVHFPFSSLFLASAVAAWAGGYWPGTLTAAAGYLAADLLLEPHGPSTPAASVETLAAYTVFSVVIIAFAAGIRSTRRRDRAVNAQLRERQVRLEHEISERRRLEAQHADAVRREHDAREEAEAARRQLQERVEELEKLMDLIPIGIYVAHDRECLRITGNRTAGALVSTDPRSNLSRTAPAAERQVRPHRLFQHGRELPPNELPLQRAAREGIALSGEEYEVVFDDGSVKHLYGYASPLFDKHGAIRGALAALMDITSRKQTEAQLEEAHARISAILESITDAFYALDREWRYTYVNHQAELYYGVERHSLLGRSIWEVFPILLDSESYTQYQRAMRDSVPVHFELHSPTTKRWIEIHAYPSPQGLSVFFRDIEARKRSAQEVERLNRELNGRVGELETLLELLPVGVWIGNANCEQLIGNRAAYEILGLPFGINASMTSPQAAQPPLVHLRFSINGEPVPPEQLPMHRAARDGVPYENVEYDVVRADGSVRSVYGSAAPLFDDDGKVRAVVGAHTDITERKQTEIALRQADRRKDEFLATLAHELRNPLSPIRSALAILRMQSGHDSGPQWPGEVIDRQVRQMARLLDDLLDVSRITLNRLELRRERALLADIVAVAVETSRPMIDASGHRLDLDLPPQAIYLDADATRLAQVFSNLLNNAAKYTDRGGRIAIRAKLAGRQVSIVIEDNGIGIAPERLAQVFDMFSQEQPALDRSHSGLGIGLALSRALVQMHGGDIEAHSAGRGRGSRFSVVLPVIDSGADAGDAVGTTPTGSGAPRRILVVDDNRDSAESLALYLELLGHTVRMAHDGNEAVNAAAALRPDAVLLDIGLPGQNGYEVARSLRGTAWGRELLLIAITGWGQEADKRRARESGFDIHLTKPVDPRTIVDLLQTARSSAHH